MHMNPMDREKLREIASAIVRVPDQYLLVVEDSIPKGNEQEQCFIWEDAENGDNKIEIVLDLSTGILTRLNIDIEDLEQEVMSLEALGVLEAGNPNSDADVRKVANAFVAKYAPEFEKYSFVVVNKRSVLTEYIYREEVGGLPLPQTGCIVRVDPRSLNVIRYRLEGWRNRKTRRPEWPERIVSEGTVAEYVRSILRMDLKITLLYPSMYEMEEAEPVYRLVYEPIPERPYIDAVSGKNLHEPEHYEMPPSRPLPLSDSAPVSSAAYDETLSLEQLLGIDMDCYQLEKSVDDGERMKSVYHLKDWEETDRPTDALSIDAYMVRKWGDRLRPFSEPTIMLQVEKQTGRLARYHRSDWPKEGVPTLNRQQCWEKAEQFLSRVFPDYMNYLELEDDHDDSDGEPGDREFFYLPVYINGIPVNHERITISISTFTGEVCMYIGVSYAMIQELSGKPDLPKISAKQAADCYLQQMQMRLEWCLADDDEDEGAKGQYSRYRLVYIPTACSTDHNGDPENERMLRYIDAITGEFIWGK